MDLTFSGMVFLSKSSLSLSRIKPNATDPAVIAIAGVVIDNALASLPPAPGEPPGTEAESIPPCNNLMPAKTYAAAVMAFIPCVAPFIATVSSGYSLA